MAYYSERNAEFLPWQPSTWPEPDPDFSKFLPVLAHIFKETLIDEIGNVINDATKVNGDLQHRGHVVALALFCAVDAIAGCSR